MPAPRALPVTDPRQVTAAIDAIARISEPGPGITRLAYSPLERDAHALVTSWFTELGLTVAVDPAGNTIAELAPSEPGSSLAAIGTGSHLDSVPHGGRFDGIAGVVAAVEVARAAVEYGVVRSRPWRFVVFAAEEGARFGQACNGSRFVAGLSDAGDAARLIDADGVDMADAMRSVGLAPDRLAEARWDPDDWHAFVELHVEQGAVLETRGATIGVVDAISGSTRLSVTLTGQASHTGSTPMHLRRDALIAASECVLECERLASDAQHRGTRATVGRLEVSPGSITTIPGRVDFTVDVRDVDSDRQRATTEALMGVFTAIAERREIGIETELLGDTSPVVLPADLVELLAEAAEARGHEPRILTSGASHDAQQINRVTRAGMIFVPSAHGLSHVPEEHTSAADLAAGIDVLLDAMIRLDAER